MIDIDEGHDAFNCLAQITFANLFETYKSWRLLKNMIYSNLCNGSALAKCYKG